MRKRLLSFVLALALCLGLTVPSLAAEEKPLTRAGLAVLLARYGDPENFDQGYGEELLDCDGLSEEEKAAVTAVVNARWMTSPTWGVFAPDTELLCWNTVSTIARAIDPGFESSSAPKRPNIAIAGSDGPWTPEPGTPLVTEAEYELAYAKWERQYNEWAEQMRSKFTTLPSANGAIAHALCEPLEILYNRGVLDPNAVTGDMWMRVVTETTAEKWVKAAFEYIEPGEPVGPAEPVVPSPAAPAFADVSADAHYAEPVKWAVERKITGGTGDGTTFSPTQLAATRRF